MRPLRLRHLRLFTRSPPSRRTLSSPPSQQPQPSPPTASKHPTLRSRLRVLATRLPRPVQRYTTPLLTAPISHVLSFLILHEISAVVPLVGLAAGFHYAGWLPALSEGEWVRAGVERYGRWMRKKGWVGREEVEEAEREVGREVEDGSSGQGKGVWRREGARWLVEIGTAYAIVKALLVPRLIFSAWATPWFARVVVVPVGGLMRRIVKR